MLKEKRVQSKRIQRFKHLPYLQPTLVVPSHDLQKTIRV